jgi:repressor LexA
MLTVRETKAMCFIQDYVSQNGGVAPTVAEIRDAVGYASKHPACRMLQDLAKRGYLRRLRQRERAIEVLRPVRVAYFKFDEDAKELKMITPG